MAEPLTTDAPGPAPASGSASAPESAPDAPARAWIATTSETAGEVGLPMPYAVHAAIRARADAETAPLVDALLRPSLALEPLLPDADAGAAPDGPAAAPSAGRLGGLPALPEGTEWPEFAGRPMQFVAQLDCAGLAEAFRTTGDGGDWPLPGEGLLLFFHDEWISDFSGRGCRVLHVPAGAPLRPAPETELSTPVVPAVPVRARWQLSAPSYQDRELENVFPDDFMIALDLASDFRELLPDPDVRVLGWCDTDSGRPAGHRPLLQIENRALDVDWGECVNVSFWITDEDLAAGRFDEVRQGFEVA
ncbi:DUF1963 domain-containing protein [Kitasatospora sp. NPDC127111]|uniref:DUF1963 domain-containing protein n=1 Tax=Kitasatospora sp. NPDC127111 TaxID=3345363 RepID=UPI00362EE645